MTLAMILLAALVQDKAPEKKPQVEVTFVLDTTGSMSGLIEGAKKKIWSIVNEIASAKPAPIVKVGFVIYRDKGDEYVTKIFDLQDDLDKAFATLKTFQANGGGDTPEHVNLALHDGVNKIGWSKDKDIYKVIFLVGDAPPHMDYNDGFDYHKHCKEAAERDITINTVRCGGDAECQKIWQEISRLAEGKYLSIDQTGGMTAISTPFDKDLADLSGKIELTTVAMHGKGQAQKESRENNDALDERSKADRGAFNSKGGQCYSGWDLVTGCMDKRVKIEDLKEEELPDEMKKMTKEERAKFVEAKIAERKECQQKIADLEQKRKAFIDEEMKKKSSEKDSFDSAVLKTIREQGEKKGLNYK